jgi:hypothetical protein
VFSVEDLKFLLLVPVSVSSPATVLTFRVFN